MSLDFLHIGWPNAVVGEATPQKPIHKTPQRMKQIAEIKIHIPVTNLLPRT